MANLKALSSESYRVLEHGHKQADDGWETNSAVRSIRFLQVKELVC